MFNTESYKVNWSEFKDFCNTRKLSIQYYEDSNNYWLCVVDGWLKLTTVISKLDPANSDLVDFETNYKSISNLPIGNPIKPLPSNIDETGKKLFARLTGLPPVTVLAGQAENFDFSFPYSVGKVNSSEIIGCNAHDIADFFVLDDNVGTYTTVPNYTLNQYGFDVNLKEGFHEFYCEYPGTIYQNMILRVRYENKSDVDTKVSINLKIHELK